ncbi:hypothetical protein CRV01_09420 [Arcobacter sp. CECT 8983]|uniref:inverse autotransporter beta domain-containing protein n=1 Tax=Arcobacter sp. CECT 8983 TaxID=2044508 RepID=UPI00100C011A|nr:inverse autotransporter beta domain-containing protein [Arcobacter sp. CECT 8983]RXJ88833.1 hypothetical protein CRV01_09420 [Arcobacter sp. CECT 8983]
MDEKRTINLFISLIWILLVITYVPAAEKEKKWEAYLDVEGKLGSHRHLAEGDFFLPLVQDDNTLLYTDIRYRLDNESSREGNFGLGLREILPSDWIIGGYTYYDRRKTPYDNYFSQITAGFEVLSVDWDFRANVYIPIGTTSHLEDTLSLVDFSGTSIMYSQGEERSMKGYDAEIGYRLPIFEAQDEQQIRIYAGGFRFYEDDVQSVQGPRGRIDLTFDEVPFLWEGSRLTLGAEVQRDDVRGRQSFATLRIRIPFGNQKEKSAPIQKLSAIEKRMTTPIIRDVDIVSQAGVFDAPKEVTADANGNRIKFVKSDSTTGANLTTTIESAGENSTVVLNGDFSGVDSYTSLKEGQTIIGGGSMGITTPAGKKVSVLIPNASITGKGAYFGNANTFFNMANNSSLIGISANLNHTDPASGTNMFYINNVNNVTIKDNNFSLSASDGTNFYMTTIIDSTNVYIGNNTMNMKSDGDFSYFMNVLGRQNKNITVEKNAYNVSGTALPIRTFYVYRTTIENLKGSGNTTNLNAAQMRTWDGDSSIINGSISFTNGFTVTLP